MDLRLLGPIEAHLDGHPIALGAPKQRALLAMLALEAGRTVSTDRLAEGLWGEQPPHSAAKMVQLYVSHLRRLLDGNGASIVTHGRGYELRLAGGDVDALRFARLLDEARPREALALWRGEPLADVAGGTLATNAPPPSRDGRTYVFTLRPGLRFSDGRPVRPADFRASIERFLRVTRDDFPPYFAGIVGAPRCVERPARCDLSRGIDTDDRSRTITVRLTRPDAEFLHKLTTHWAYVVPADTPIRLTGDRPPPGTGPYRIAAWDADRGGRLVRNPHFRAWSPQSRPAGFADRIEVAVRREQDIEAQIADVRRGAADMVVLANPFRSYVEPQRLTALTAGSPGQLHSAPEATTDWMFLNVRRRPFDDVGVRRALNYATDRARIVDIAGGPQLAGATCQVVPAGFPGYEPHCPYTASPVRGRGWTAPDLDRARGLVARSGRAGERAVILVPDFQREIGRYFAALLDELGFRSSLRVLGQEYFPTVLNARSRAQIGFVGWALDFVSPASFIQPNFGCAGREARPENASRLCDPVLAGHVRRALAAQGAEASAAWAAADRRLVGLAPAVPMTNRRSVVFVSKRVGNVQQHLMWFTLLDQLWVR